MGVWAQVITGCLEQGRRRAGVRGVEGGQRQRPGPRTHSLRKLEGRGEALPWSPLGKRLHTWRAGLGPPELWGTFALL